MSEELKSIKKLYGEEMMHLCRELFPSILEQEGLLLSILKQNLAPTHSFINDIKMLNLYEEFKNWIYSFVDVEKKEVIVPEKTPFELMDEAGYILYECKTEEDIQKFRKYYAEDEELCTFRGGRLDRCYVFFAVKKNVDEIKRENFPNPQREDEYGTSVISIQFSRGKTNDVSIKNRYNHTVNNPDYTFSNNLDNIIEGLASSFEIQYRFKYSSKHNSQSKFLTDELYYVRANDGKYYRYNLEMNFIYYCENNIIIKDGQVIKDYYREKERYVLIEQFIVDIKAKRVFAFDDQLEDSFISSINDIGKIKNIKVLKNGNKRVICIQYEDDKIVNIEINKHNLIIGYENKYVEKIDGYFLYYNRTLTEISIPKVKTIDYGFLTHNYSLTDISLPEVEIIGNNFLFNNNMITSISLPKVKRIDDGFLSENDCINSVYLPEVEIIGNNFLFENKSLMSISLPKVTLIGNDFLFLNKKLVKINIPEVTRIGRAFLNENIGIRSISLPKVGKIGDSFLFSNDFINSVNLPKVKTIGANFIFRNKALSSISLPEVESIDYYFLYMNYIITNLEMPKLKEVRSSIQSRLINQFIEKMNLTSEEKRRR